MIWLEFAGWMLAAAAVGFWGAWRLRGEALARERRELKYLKSLWARMGEESLADNAGSSPPPPAAADEHRAPGVVRVVNR